MATRKKLPSHIWRQCVFCGWQQLIARVKAAKCIYCGRKDAMVVDICCPVPELREQAKHYTMRLDCP